MKNYNFYKKLIIGAFLLVPIFSSFISTLHVVNLFSIGNITWIAVCLAIIFELGQLSSLLTLTILDKINKTVVWSIFITLAIMQILGNVYYSFEYISLKLIDKPEWLNIPLELINKFASRTQTPADAKFIIALIIGVPVPLISIAFLKSLVDYLKVKETDDKVEEVKPKVEIKHEEPKVEIKHEEPKVEIKHEEPKEEVKPKTEKAVKRKDNFLDDTLKMITEIENENSKKAEPSKLQKKPETKKQDNISIEKDLGTIEKEEPFTPFINNK